MITVCGIDGKVLFYKVISGRIEINGLTPGLYIVKTPSRAITCHIR